MPTFHHRASLPLIGDADGSSVTSLRLSRKSGDGGCQGLPKTQHGSAHAGRVESYVTKKEVSLTLMKEHSKPGSVDVGWRVEFN